jgi:hypothetical protein
MTEPEIPDTATKDTGLTSGRFPSVDLFADACHRLQQPEPPRGEEDDASKPPD